ncbi:MAG: hypothetical protein V7727_19270 [Sneathiella sp.]
MTRRLELTQLPDWPRLMSLSTAAAYCDMSEPHFKKHFQVTPLQFGKRNLYDKTAIDKILNGSQSATDWTEKLNDN